MENLIVNILFATLLGAAVGFKEEHDANDNHIILGGFRTHALLALMGGISGTLITQGNYLFATLLTIPILVMIVMYYISGVMAGKAYGITDEMSAIFAHFIGILIASQAMPVKIVTALTVLVIFITTRKAEIRGLGQKVNAREVREFTLFAIIALVILPFLPNTSYTLNDLGLTQILSALNFPGLDKLLNIELINPFKVWFIVVFVSGIELLGYLLAKFISSEKSALLSATVGGFVSSTSTTISLAIQSKAKDGKAKLNTLVGAALAANGSSFIQILILVAPISITLFQRIFLPTLILMVGCFVAALVLSREKKQLVAVKEDKEFLSDNKNIFKLGPALRFAVILTLVKLLTNLALIYLGNSGFVVTSMLAAITGIDAVTINVAELTNLSQITLDLAFLTYMGVNFVNLLGKVIYSFGSGDVAFAKRFALAIGMIFTAALAVGLLI